MHQRAGMPVAGVKKGLDACASLQEALRELCAPFLSGKPEEIACEEVGKDQMPEPFHWLLVHRNHMTKVLEAQYGRPMELEVLEHHLDDDSYTRKIILRPAGTDVVVEFGVVRLKLQYVSAEVRKEILERKTPLGAILIRHKVLRRVEPKWYLRFPARAHLPAQAGVTFDHVTYGRVGIIHCNEEPAIELLEIVSGLEKTFDERVV